jgi:hypothetical protein
LTAVSGIVREKQTWPVLKYFFKDKIFLEENQERKLFNTARLRVVFELWMSKYETEEWDIPLFAKERSHFNSRCRSGQKLKSASPCRRNSVKGGQPAVLTPTPSEIRYKTEMDHCAVMSAFCSSTD